MVGLTVKTGAMHEWILPFACYQDHTFARKAHGYARGCMV